MTQQTIYIGGSETVTVPATESIAVSNFGGGVAKIYYWIVAANVPDDWQYQQSIENEEVVLGPFSVAQLVRIDAGTSKVLFDIGASPATGTPASTLGGLTAAQFLRSDADDDFTGSNINLDNSSVLNGRDTGDTARAIAQVDGSDILQIGAAALPTNINSDGTLTHNSNAILDVSNYLTTGFIEGNNIVYNPLNTIWQRGAGAFTTTDGYAADGNRLEYVGTSGSISQTTGATINGYTDTEFGLALTHTAGSAAGDYCRVARPCEDVRNIHDTTATINVVANIPSGNSAAISLLQNFGSGGSADVRTGSSALLVGTGAAATYTVTVSIPTISAKTIGADNYLAVEFWTDAGSTFDAVTNSLGHQTSGTSYVYATQLRPGVRDNIIEIPTPESIISQCYRYYFLMGGQSVAYTRFAEGYWVATTYGYAATFLPVPLRKIPTSWTQSGPFYLTNGAGGAVATGISIDSSGTTTQAVNWLASSASGGTAGYQLTVSASSDGATSLGVTAEY